MEQILYHHGIKGQKWGVRRYQNPDGTLTAAGQRRKKYAQTQNGSYKTNRALNDVLMTDKKYAKSSNSQYDKEMKKAFTKYEKLSKRDEKKALANGDYVQYGRIAAGRTYLRTLVDSDFRVAVTEWGNLCAKGEAFVQSISRDDDNGGVLLTYNDGTKVRTSDDNAIINEAIKRIKGH